MNALVRKEVRSILPAWGLAMLLAIVPVWILWPGTPGPILDNLSIPVFVLFAIGVLVLSLVPFGQELNWGTFSVLLSQPISRRRLWVVKTLVLGMALATVFLAMFVSNHMRVDSVIETMKHTIWRNAFDRPGERTEYFVRLIAGIRRAAFVETVTIGGLAALVGFAGGLWTTLLLRQVTAAFWLTVLVPVSLLLLVGKILGNFPEPIVQTGVVAVLAGYSAAGFVWARRLFMQAQDTQWTGGVISFSIRSMTSRTVVAGERTRKVLRALMVREFEAQFVNLLLAAGILVLHLVVVLIRKLNADYLAVHRSVAMTLEAFPVLWLAMPLLIGSVVIAEERKSGTLAVSLCLPASRRFQFATRAVLTMFVGIFCGSILPLLVEFFASWLGLGQNPAGVVFLSENLSTLAFQVLGATAITGLALYGSSLARNSLQAIGLGVLSCLIGCVIIFGALHAEIPPEFVLWRGPLIAFIGLPVMLLTWFLLTYRNSQQLQLDTRTWVRNGLAWFVSILGVAVVTSTLYHRVWEAWLPEEPLHRAFPTFNGSRAKILASGFRTAVLLPHGRLWLKQTETHVGGVVRTDQGIIAWQTKGRSHSGIVDSSTWKDVAISWNRTYAIKADGTLWDLSGMSNGEFRPRRVGQSHDWVSVCAGADYFCGLQGDGTVWQWGGGGTWFGRGRLSTQIPEPSQVGTDADWSAIGSYWDAAVLSKTDGSIWRLYWASPKHPYPEPWLKGACSSPVSITVNDHALACVCNDGTLWFGCDNTNFPYARLIGPESTELAAREMVRWGNDSDWKEIHWVGWGTLVGIKRDGSLWHWDLNARFGPWSRWVISPEMPSQYSDWICAGADNNAYLALARDGSLCLWGDPVRYNDWNGPDPRRLLMPTRIKARRVENFSPER